MTGLNNRGFTFRKIVDSILTTESRSILLRSVHLGYSSVLCESENKENLFPSTTLTDWFI